MGPALPPTYSWSSLKGIFQVWTGGYGPAWCTSIECVHAYTRIWERARGFVDSDEASQPSPYFCICIYGPLLALCLYVLSGTTCSPVRNNPLVAGRVRSSVPICAKQLLRWLSQSGLLLERAVYRHCLSFAEPPLALFSVRLSWFSLNFPFSCFSALCLYCHYKSQHEMFCSR